MIAAKETFDITGREREYGYPAFVPSVPPLKWLTLKAVFKLWVGVTSVIGSVFVFLMAWTAVSIWLSR